MFASLSELQSSLVYETSQKCLPDVSARLGSAPRASRYETTLAEPFIVAWIKAVRLYLSVFSIFALVANNFTISCKRIKKIENFDFSI
jgi:hypothetical protein